MVSLGNEPESILGQPIYPSVNVLELQRMLPMMLNPAIGIQPICV